MSIEAFEKNLIKEISNFKCYFTGQENFLLGYGFEPVVNCKDDQMLVSIFMLIYMKCIILLNLKFLMCKAVPKYKLFLRYNVTRLCKG